MLCQGVSSKPPKIGALSIKLNAYEPGRSHILVDVGNKAAVFPLQLLGFDVDVINSVHFSNHTGYQGGWTGDVLNGDQLRSILDGLEKNGLLHDVSHLLTGYIGSESFLTAVLEVLKTLRKHSKVRFVCDPVLGDAGSFYVPQELVKVYREKVIPLADVVTPNQFEVEQLTGVTIKTLEDAKKACQILLDMGPTLVFITSLELQTEAAASDEPVITILSAKRSELGDEFWRIDSPLFAGHFTGTGDLTAALLLGHTAKTPNDLKGCMEKVVSTMHVVIERTHNASGATVLSKELKLIASKDDIENPPSLFEARRI
jgi:pyridoxine kinase